MKELSILLLATFFINVAIAQNQTTIRQQSFPTDLLAEDENIEWERDIYRELDLTADENAGLYCPQNPTEDQRGLFVMMMNLAVDRTIPIYRYNIDGNEAFDEDSEIDIKDILVNHNIPYIEEGKNLRVYDEDMPSAEVLAYFIKEGVGYNNSNSSYRTRVKAFCPILMEEDEFGDGMTRYPLFWVRYRDLEPYMKEMTVIPDYRNKAKKIPMTDYFTRNLYKGKIYKVANAHGKTLRQIADSDSVLTVIQKGIEEDLKLIRKRTYNTYYAPASHKNHIRREERIARATKRRSSTKENDAIKDDSNQ